MPEPVALTTPQTICPEQLVRFADKPGWYHSIELAPGVVTRGAYDHTPLLHHYRFPDTLEGWSVLDVGASEGFFAFEFETRGASDVLAVDTDRFDGTPALSLSVTHAHKYVEKYRRRAATNRPFEQLYQTLGVPCGHHTLAAATLRRSQVRFERRSVYDLDQLDHKYDLVFCGDLFTHLKNPITAAEQLAATTGRLCIVALANALPAASDAPQAQEKQCEYVGDCSGGAFFHFAPECLRRLLLASGFHTVNIVSRFDLPDRARGLTNPHAVLHCIPHSNAPTP